MTKFVSIVFLVVFVCGPVIQANPISYLPYAFSYQTADGIARQEQGSSQGVVTGSYSYTDANGDIRQVKYVADQHGYRPEGDIGVDRKTAEAAAALAALAPQPIPQSSYYQSAPSVSPIAYQQYTAPAPISAPVVNWGGAPLVSAPVLSKSSALSYSVDTPTHKIWVKY